MPPNCVGSGPRGHSEICTQQLCIIHALSWILHLHLCLAPSIPPSSSSISLSLSQSFHLSNSPCAFLSPSLSILWPGINSLPSLCVVSSGCRVLAQHNLCVCVCLFFPWTENLTSAREPPFPEGPLLIHLPHCVLMADSAIQNRGV